MLDDILQTKESSQNHPFSSWACTPSSLPYIVFIDSTRCQIETANTLSLLCLELQTWKNSKQTLTVVHTFIQPTAAEALLSVQKIQIGDSYFPTVIGDGISFHIMQTRTNDSMFPGFCLVITSD